MDGANQYKSYLLNAETALGSQGTDGRWLFVLGDYNGDGRPDLYGINKIGTGAGDRTEVHIMDGANQYKSYLLNAETALGSSGVDGRWDFATGQCTNAPWVSWSSPDLSLLLSFGGGAVDIAYDNISTPATLNATLSGAATFADGTQIHTITINQTSGSYTLHLQPAAGGIPGSTFTLQANLAGSQLEREGTIAWELYLPLLTR
jgi:hypothetical protein